MAPPPVLLLQDIRLTFGGTPLLTGAALSVAPGERLALVGRNGSGKSSLLKIAAGLIEADAGSRFVQPGATVRYLPQEPDLAGHPTTLAYVQSGLGPGDDPYRARYLLEHLGLTGAEDPQRLSGGEVRRAALARVLAPDPDILLLDEPTNHIDLPTIAWLEGELAAARAAVVLISHDRRLLTALSRATVWLDRGVARRLERGFAAFEAWRDEILEKEETAAHKLSRQIAREEDWLRYGVTARRKRNQRRLADLERLRARRRSRIRAPGRATLAASEGDGSGQSVIVAEAIGKAYGGEPVVRGFSTRILRGDRIGIVGRNGAGKTTLLNLLTGTLTPDEGRVGLGTAIQMAVLDQRRQALDPATSLADTLTGGRGDTVFVGGAPRHVFGYMKDFLFTPEQARTPVGALSGGERGRLMLARALAQPSNLLVLDEPTNDLDLETLDLLEEMLADYAGTLLVVSHDRDFLDRVATSVIVAEGGGRWQEYAGGYSDMLAQRGRGVEAEAPTVASATARKASPPPLPASPPTPVTARIRLSFQEQHALKTLPARIAELETRLVMLRATLADPTLYSRDRGGFERQSAELAATEAALAAAEDEWLALEIKRETAERR
ncbi:MAG: ABC-F family ATP-binding cassette domain-containing protein [Rhodospirillales bacterium]|jgi:ATP-binding cassette subfamily F protein uup|nr:ABC-F family ATP-binding cassette domain-containing protein [Rhodospirillales bacterium]